MVAIILSVPEHQFEWVDITNPKREDFIALKEKYGLKDVSIKDCLEVGHLPKIEEFDNYHFLILRSIPSIYKQESDKLTEITERVSIFYSENFIITVHRNDIEYLEKTKSKDKSDKKLASSKSLVNSLVSEALMTFEKLVLDQLAAKLDYYEEIVFLHRRRKLFLKKLYFIKRQIDVIRIILTLYKDIVDYFHMPQYQNIYTQDLRDLFTRTNTLYRNTGENIAQLLSVYFNIESNHTNEIMRTLTIISVFFMPLTFIVGVYGMNFRNMPELEWYYGYPAVLLAMLGLSILIYVWFKRKDWL
ncbi:magnesium transporter CorA [Sphingobacterium alkalisoli]|uniref:Magnesium transporter CorA n=1 Tax=Sphingobacterium alkalisoli TaxID=1874115 RepID=A0A4V5LXC3_9SPHI|nr:CorA family divalent cation transporter [Sphingobacterium alkalisoli]TJY60749.1 magnesium transporter CorA [Sphingobacterium alkalisoli]GGH31711.1 magnesium transport protein CorA [Sphingobacterium alkalisoli]